MKGITAVGNSKLKEKLEEKGIVVSNVDIQYKEGILEYLEERQADYIILYERLAGEVTLKQLIYQIKKKIKNIIIIIEDEAMLLWLKKEHVFYIKKDDPSILKKIIYEIKRTKYISGWNQFATRKKYRKKKCNNKRIKKAKLERKQYQKTQNRKIIGMINLFHSKNEKIEKQREGRRTSKIKIKNWNQKIIIEIEDKQWIINQKEWKKFILYLKLKRGRGTSIFLSIETKELLEQKELFYRMSQTVWVIEDNLESIRNNKTIMQKFQRFLPKFQILCSYHSWRGIEPNIIKHIFSKCIVVKTKEIGGAKNGIRTGKFIRKRDSK